MSGVRTSCVHRAWSDAMMVAPTDTMRYFNSHHLPGYLRMGCDVREKEISLRLYSRVVVCEIRKIEVYYIDFSRPSTESKSGRGIH